MSNQEFMFLFIGGHEKLDTLSPDEMQRHMERWGHWIADMREQGVYQGGNPLESGGKTIAGPNLAVHDGPFAEAKEIVGGYIIITADNLETAVDIGKNCPIFENEGRVEVRAIRQLDL